MWAAEEYALLPGYDLEVFEQPVGVFMCHQQDGRVCAGWASVSACEETLALRLAVTSGRMPMVFADSLIDFVSPVPVFESGSAAAAHGLREIECPGAEARAMIEKITRRLSA